MFDHVFSTMLALGKRVSIGWFSPCYENVKDVMTIHFFCLSIRLLMKTQDHLDRGWNRHVKYNPTLNKIWINEDLCPKNVNHCWKSMENSLDNRQVRSNDQQSIDSVSKFRSMTAIQWVTLVEMFLFAIDIDQVNDWIQSLFMHQMWSYWRTGQLDDANYLLNFLVFFFFQISFARKIELILFLNRWKTTAIEQNRCLITRKTNRQR